MKKYLNLLLIISFVLVLPVAASAACTQTLYAGRNIDVGTVTLADDGTITYTTKDGWVMTETHLHVATSLSGIPHTRQGNPIPGQFRYKRYHNPGVTTETYSVGTYWCGKSLYVAAHAVVVGYSQLQSMTIVSDTTTLVVKGNDPAATYPKNAVAAWEPFDDPADPAASYWDEEAGGAFAGTTADWIWESYRPLHPVSGDIVEFEKTFTVPGKVVSGTLDITCDNGYEARLNGQLVGSAQLFGDWRTPTYCDQDGKYMFLRDPIYDEDGNVLVPGVERYGWKSTEDYDLPTTTKYMTSSHWRRWNKHKSDRCETCWHEKYDVTDKLKCSGTNTKYKLQITGVNEAMSSETICGYTDQGFDGTVDDNPAGLIYKLEIKYSTGDGQREETAWAAGNAFPGNNWATYFTCTIPCP